MEPDVMVYLMTGFLDSGKTQFLKFTLEQEYFQIDGTTLLILCEEGEEEYSPEMLKEHRIVMETIDDPEALTEEWLENWMKNIIQNELLSSTMECGRSVILKV